MWISQSGQENYAQSVAGDQRILTNLLLLAAISSTFDWHIGKCFWQQKFFLPSQTTITICCYSCSHFNHCTVLRKEFVFFRSNLFCLNDASKVSNFPREINGINNLDLTHPIVQIVWERQEEQFSCYHLSKVWMLAILDLRKFN